MFINTVMHEIACKYRVSYEITRVCCSWSLQAQSLIFHRRKNLQRV